MELVGVKKIIESILFVSNRSVSMEQFKEVLDASDAAMINAALAALKKDYEEDNHGIHLMEVAGGYQLCTDPFCAPWIKKLFKTKQAIHLSGPSLETVAIIAYKQPITRPEIELIRGVNVDGVLKTLLERNLVKIKGRRDSPGRPIVYGTTEEFLQYFGLKSLKDLPPLEEFVKEYSADTTEQKILPLEEPVTPETLVTPETPNEQKPEQENLLEANNDTSQTEK